MTRLLFVCTGNICRSAMAEGIARQRLGGSVEVGSAGTWAVTGSGATRGAVDAAAEIGVDLTGHRARPVDAAMAASADRVYCATRAHLAEVRRLAGDAASVELMDPNGRDIEDPYGLDLAAYRTARDEVVAAIDARLPEWREMASGAGA